MGRGKKNPAGHRGGDARDRHAARGSDDRELYHDPEDDPFRDLRPEEDDSRNQPVDDYVWPDLSSESEEDD